MSNPYEPPSRSSSSRRRGSSSISSRMLTPLEKTKLWARLLSILGFTFCALILFLSVTSLAKGVFGYGVIIQIIVIGIVYLYPSFKLGQYANRISRASLSLDESDFVSALEAQHAIWRFMGIIGIVSVVFVFMSIVLMFANAFA